MFNLPSVFFKEAADQSESTSTEDERMLSDLEKMGKAAKDLRMKADAKVAEVVALQKRARAEVTGLENQVFSLAEVAALKEKAVVPKDRVTGLKGNAATLAKLKGEVATLYGQVAAKTEAVLAKEAALKDQRTGRKRNAAADVAALKREVAKLKGKAIAKVQKIQQKELAILKEKAAAEGKAALNKERGAQQERATTEGKAALGNALKDLKAEVADPYFVRTKKYTMEKAGEYVFHEACRPVDPSERPCN